MTVSEAVLASSHYPAVLDPTLTPEQEIDKPLAGSSASGDQVLSVGHLAGTGEGLLRGLVRSTRHPSRDLRRTSRDRRQGARRHGHPDRDERRLEPAVHRICERRRLRRRLGRLLRGHLSTARRLRDAARPERRLARCGAGEDHREPGEPPGAHCSVRRNELARGLASLHRRNDRLRHRRRAPRQVGPRPRRDSHRHLEGHRLGVLPRRHVRRRGLPRQLALVRGRLRPQGRKGRQADRRTHDVRDLGDELHLQLPRRRSTERVTSSCGAPTTA